MSQRVFQSSKTAPLLYLFNRNRASTVRFEDAALTVWAKSGRIAQSVRADEVQEVKLRKLPLINRLTVLTKQGQATTLGPQITGPRDSITSHLAPGRYIRRSHTAGMTPSAGKLAGQLDERARQKLNAGAGQALRGVNGGVKVVHAGGQSLVIDTVEVQDKCPFKWPA